MTLHLSCFALMNTLIILFAARTAFGGVPRRSGNINRIAERQIRQVFVATNAIDKSTQDDLHYDEDAMEMFSGMQRSAFLNAGGDGS